MAIAGWKDLVICGYDPDPSKTAADLVAKGYNHYCTFGDLVRLTNNFIQDLVIIATILTTAVFIWAGLRLISATFTGNVGALGEARKTFLNVLKGYAWILAGWVVVYTILHALVRPEYWLLG